MNKAKRDELRQLATKVHNGWYSAEQMYECLQRCDITITPRNDAAFIAGTSPANLRGLLDYVDALEAAMEKIAHLDDVHATPAGAGNQALKIAREVLAKGKA